MHSKNNSQFLDRLRHVLNPLHVYCRLTSLGVPSRFARNICRTYESFLYRPTLGNNGR